MLSVPRTLVELSAARAVSHPDHLAVDDGARRLTYAETWERVQAAAVVLRKSGVRPGDRVLVVGRNSVPWVVSAFAVLALGATVVPLGHGATRGEKQRAVDRLGPSLVVADDRSWRGRDPRLRLVSMARLIAAPAAPTSTDLPQIDTGSPALVLATSGTTGDVKFVPMGHAQLADLYRHISGWLGLQETDVLLGAVPLAHSFGFNGVLIVAMWAGAGVRLVDRYDAAQVRALVAESGLTVLAGPPTIYHDLHLLGTPLRGVRQAIAGSTEVQADRMRAICDDLGIAELVTGYGMTETCGSVALGRIGADPGRHGWMTPLPGLETKVVGPLLSEVGPGEEGRLLVRGGHVATRYADGSRPAVDAEGWLDTGDLARRDHEGRLAIVSRVKDTVIVSGFNVVPQEVERVLTDHPGVHRAVVVGVPDARQGQRLVACVIPAGEPPASSSLDLHLRDHLAAFKVPGRFVFFDEFPTTGSGKVSRLSLRSQLLEAVG